MLTIDNRQGDLFGGWIPGHLLQLPDDLVFVDKALNDPRVLEPFLRNAKKTGRPTTPIATYLRLMYLKFRYQMSYEVLVKEVSDSYKWRVFCRLPIDKPVPDDKTLIKLTGRYGEATVKAVFDAVVQQAVEAKIIRGRKMRLDTTVTESNIHYPTDTGLLSDSVRVVSRTITKIKKVVSLKTRFRNRARSIKRRILRIAKFLGKRANRKKGELGEAKGQILRIAQEVHAQAAAVNQELIGTSNTRAAKLNAQLGRWLGLFGRVIEQTKTVLAGNVHIPNRLVSLFDPGARPIQKGKLFPRTEFGRKVLIQEAERNLVSDYQVHEGSPVDHTLLASAVDRHERIFGECPKRLAADRGFFVPGNDEKLHARRIRQVSIPAQGRKSALRERTERSGWFRRLQRWRVAGEAKISLLKRKFGLRRTLVRGTAASAIWIGWGCIAHNLLWMARAGPKA